MLQYLPNALTTLRLLLVIPLCILILEENFGWALVVGLVAGITDALDGFFARRLQAFSRYGAALDPIADKALIILTFMCLAHVGLITWLVAGVVITRDVMIITGATYYYTRIAHYEFAATLLSKINMLIQIAFCALVLADAVLSLVQDSVIRYCGVIVIAIAIASGANYVVTWTRNGLAERRKASNG